MRTAVIGAGAIGGITAAFIAKTGYSVDLVCRHGDYAERIRTEGMRVTGVKGAFSQKLSAVTDVSELRGSYDIVIIATKAADLPSAARESLPLLKKDSLVVSMQNGVVIDTLQDIVGKERAVGCTVGWGATMHRYGELEMTSTGEFVLGTLAPPPEQQWRYLTDLLSTVVPVHTTDNTYGTLYSKLLINSCITTLGAICGLPLGEMLARRNVRELFIVILDEGMRVAGAMGIRVEPYAGRLDYYRFLRGTGPLASLRRHLMIRVIGIKYRRLRSSSLQSIERGQKTEVDYFNGYIAAEGEKHGISTPVNLNLTNMLHQIEEGSRSIGVDNLDELQTLLEENHPQMRTTGTG